MSESGEVAVIAHRRWPSRRKRRRKSATLPRVPSGTRRKAPALTSNRNKAIAWLTLMCWFLCGPTGVYAATNSATGGINGNNNGTLVGGDGTGTAQIEINSVQLALVKEARDLAGNVLAPGANVAPTAEIYFVLYVDNITDFSASRMAIKDAIDEAQFTYVPNSLEATVILSGSDAVARWAGTWVPLTDALGAPDDEASVLDSAGPAGFDQLTVGEVPGQVNELLAIAARTQWAIRFRVTVN